MSEKIVVKWQDDSEETPAGYVSTVTAGAWYSLEKLLGFLRFYRPEAEVIVEDGVDILVTTG